VSFKTYPSYFRHLLEIDILGITIPYLVVVWSLSSQAFDSPYNKKKYINHLTQHDVSVFDFFFLIFQIKFKYNHILLIYDLLFKQIHEMLDYW